MNNRAGRFTSKLSDFVPIDQYRPALVTDLLRFLKKDKASPEEQRAAITEWLRTNTPIQMLAIDLADQGYEVPARTSE